MSNVASETERDKQQLVNLVLGNAHTGQSRVVREEDMPLLLRLIKDFNYLASRLRDNPYPKG